MYMVKAYFLIIINIAAIFRYRLQWSHIADSCRKRRKYVQLYASCLNQGFKVNNQEIKDMEKDLDIEVILLWRLAFSKSLLKL
jgi:hypothetical protein